MKNVVFFVSGLNSGGLENYLLRFLRDKGHGFDRVIVFCKSGSGGQLEEEFIKFKNVELHFKKIAYVNPFDILYLIKFFKTNNISTVCDFTGNFAGIPLLSAKLANVTKRTVFYRGSTNRFQETFFNVLYNNFVKFLTKVFSTKILSNSVSALNYFYGDSWQNNSKYKVIYNGINLNYFPTEVADLRAELQIPKDAFVVGHVGRYHFSKNHKVIVSVAEKICRQNNDVYFILCGNDVPEKLNTDSKNIILLDYRSDIPNVLKTFDCYYFPSVTEGQPNALIEAMGMNVPFVASTIPPIVETVPDNLHEYLCDPNDEDKAFELILKLKNNKEQRAQFKLRNWIATKYDPNLLFGEFSNELIQNN